MITPAQDISIFVIDITAGQAGGGGVPSSRKINTAAPLAGGGDLSADRTLTLTMTPQLGVAVGSGRVISGTTPLLINGGPNATLASDITISQNAFDGNNAGYVNPDPGGADGTRYLNNQAQWTASTVSGVPSNRTLTMVPPLTIGGLASADLSADRTIDAGIFTAAVKGFVPGSGGVATNVLHGDGTWGPVTAANAVTLQTTTPGTADHGNAHIDGVFIAETEVVAGSTKKSLNGGGTEPLYVKQASPTTQPVVASYFNGGQTAGIDFRAARGTEASPTQVNVNDELMSFNVEPAYSPTVFDRGEFMTVTTRAAKGVSHIPFDVDIKARGSSPGDPQLNLRLGGNALGGIMTSTSPLPASGFEVGTSFGMTTKAIVSNGPGYTYTISELADPSLFTVDATLGFTTVVLPPASGRSGRIYSFTKVDEAHACVIQSSSGLVNGGIGWNLFARGDAATLFSDGSNWWLLSSHSYTDQIGQAADSSPLVNTTTETIMANFGGIGANLVVGNLYEGVASGWFSTNGNPSLRFRFYNSGGSVISDSGILETPNSVTNVAWTAYISSYTQIIAQGRIIDSYVKLTAADGVRTEFSMMSTFTNPSNGPQPSYMTIQWGTADPGNTITTTAARVKLVPKIVVL